MDRFKMVNAFFIILLAGIFITTLGLFYIKYDDIFYERTEKVKIDTVYVYVEDSTAVVQIDSLYSKIDSLEAINLKYEEELTIALFKLERIRDYNEIAKKGNNIKYLRGWINRVLNDWIMCVELYGRKFIVTDMFVIGKDIDAILRYNVFDEKYNHVVTIDADDYDDFIKKFKLKLLTNKI